MLYIVWDRRHVSHLHFMLDSEYMRRLESATIGCQGINLCIFISRDRCYIECIEKIIYYAPDIIHVRSHLGMFTLILPFDLLDNKLRITKD